MNFLKPCLALRYCHRANTQIRKYESDESELLYFEVSYTTRIDEVVTTIQFHLRLDGKFTDSQRTNVWQYLALCGFEQAKSTKTSVNNTKAFKEVRPRYPGTKTNYCLQ